MVLYRASCIFQPLILCNIKLVLVFIKKKANFLERVKAVPWQYIVELWSFLSTLYVWHVTSLVRCPNPRTLCFVEIYYMYFMLLLLSDLLWRLSMSQNTVFCGDIIYMWHVISLVRFTTQIVKVSEHCVLWAHTALPVSTVSAVRKIRWVVYKVN